MAMRSLAFASVAISSFAFGVVSAQSPAPAYGQCGGQGWSGATACESGYTCTTSSPYYSQCLPGIAGTTTSGGSSPTTTSSGAAASGSQIRTVTAPVFHFYLQDSNGKPRLGPEASSGYFTISGSISLNSESGSNLYLNINNTVSTSYKPLTLGTTATTTDWGLEGDTIVTTSPRQLNFIACSTSDPSFYDVYLQTGNDAPPGGSCTLQTMHLPCLC